MIDHHAEKVLCARSSDLPPAWLPGAGAVPMDESALFAELASIPPHWLTRRQAEVDPSFKQWIPYVLLRNHRDELAAYPRQGNEARLHGLWSLGLGGHVNPVDSTPSPDARMQWPALLWNGLRRELMEEYPGAAEGRTRFLGLIHESQSAVGRVHLGAVFLHQPFDSVAKPGAELEGMLWLSSSELGGSEWRLERFELWSRLALQLLTPEGNP